MKPGYAVRSALFLPVLCILSCGRKDLRPNEADASSAQVVSTEPHLSERPFIRALSETCRPLAITYIETAEKVAQYEPGRDTCTYDSGFHDACGCPRPTNASRSVDLKNHEDALAAWKSSGCPGAAPLNLMCEWCPSTTKAICEPRKNGVGHCTSARD